MKNEQIELKMTYGELVEMMGNDKNEVRYFRGTVHTDDWKYAVRCVQRGDQPVDARFGLEGNGAGWVSGSVGAVESPFPAENEATDGEKLIRMRHMLQLQKTRDDEIQPGEISQFWFAPYWDGNFLIEQRYVMGAANDETAEKRYPRYWSDMGWLVNRDKGRQYIAGLHITNNMGVPANPLNPVHDLKEQPFIHLGFPHLQYLQNSVGYHCFRAQFAKKYAMMAERPMEFAERRAGWIKSAYGLELKPMYANPNHPSKGAGHEAEAYGYCTVPLWFYDQSYEMTLLAVDENGEIYDTGQKTSVGDEWRKLYGDVVKGRQLAGVHWLEDSHGIPERLAIVATDALNTLLEPCKKVIPSVPYTWRGVTGEPMRLGV